MFDEWGNPQTEEARDQYLRQTMLYQALAHYSKEHPPQAIIEAAELFYEYVTGSNLEVQG